MWNRGSDLREQIPRCIRKGSIASLDHPLRPENRRLQFLRGQHQRRHIVPSIEDVPDTCLPADGNTLACQISHITVDRPHRDAQLCRNRFCCHGTARAPKDLDHSKESVGSAHRKTMLTQRCQESSATVIQVLDLSLGKHDEPGFDARHYKRCRAAGQLL